ncbi:MAG: DUF4232 domain-containing protein [Kibdelosporangium sp.]
MNVPKISILAAGSLLLLAACTGQPAPAANPQVPTIGSTSPSVEQPASQPPVSPTLSSETPPAPPAPPGPVADKGECKAASLRLSIGNGDTAAGTTFRQLVFTNTGTVPCVIQGFPGVSYVAGDDGHQVGPAAVREGAKGEAIDLAPGASAAAPVGFTQVRNYDEAVCKPTAVRGLRVYPPQETASLFIALEGTGCSGNPPGQQLSVKTIQRT